MDDSLSEVLCMNLLSKMRRIKYRFIEKYALGIEAWRLGYHLSIVGAMFGFGFLGSVCFGFCLIPQPWTSPVIYSGISLTCCILIVYCTHLGKIYGGGK